VPNWSSVLFPIPKIGFGALARIDYEFPSYLSAVLL
jgi:hypothetical protein